MSRKCNSYIWNFSSLIPFMVFLVQLTLLFWLVWDHLSLTIETVKFRCVCIEDGSEVRCLLIWFNSLDRTWASFLIKRSGVILKACKNSEDSRVAITYSGAETEGSFNVVLKSEIHIMPQIGNWEWHCGWEAEVRFGIA